MRVLAVIPARYASTRLPGKPLSKIQEKPMIQWVYEQTRKALKVNQVVVATDDERIASAVRAFGGQVVMTSPDCPSGTDRVAEALDQLQAGQAGSETFDVVVNVQGDEPFIDPRAIDQAVDLVVSKNFQMATLMSPFKSAADIENPSIVKAIAAADGRALYFSRLPIPYTRVPIPSKGPFACFRHIGLYVYSVNALAKLRALPQSPAEIAESLEQLRALENGISIGIAAVEFESLGVDTPEDLEKARALAQKRK
ncbi:MAG: 3-deoxy-manno-octulosonate cytidylyltransferase [Bdellovibrionales bacterium]|nr:3-deoxy-manno-octulosonate cytidylyltransferase [Bdellovibrionales bacterium]